MSSIQPLKVFGEAFRRLRGGAPGPLVPPAVLARADRILFIKHLAIGDFTYLQNCFKAFAEAFPHVAIHVWVDELRRTEDRAAWDQLKRYSLYDWLESCPCIKHVYRETYSPELFRQSIRAARQQNYPLVVSLSILSTRKYAALAREISPDGFVAGIQDQRWFALRRRFAYLTNLDAGVDIEKKARAREHVSAIYARWFRRLFGCEIPEAARYPFIRIPPRWDEYAGRQLAEWHFDAAGRAGRLILVNPHAKDERRCWPLERVVELICVLRERPAGRNDCFIVNSAPEKREQTAAFFGARSLERVRLFSAEENFFQLPAVLSRCDLAVSVETSIMHLANAVHVPVVALMRRNNPEWAPIDRQHSVVVSTPQRRQDVDAITTRQVVEALASFG